MEDEEAQTAVSSAFPAPPSFYKSFTTENVDRLEDHLDSAAELPLNSFKITDPTTGSLPDAASVPVELRNLLPPPPPPNGTYSVFGTVHTLNPTAADLSSPSTQAHLLYLLHQMLLKFLTITHVLSIDPSNKFYGPAWDQLYALFTEMHKGINAWRPHQTRETLIEMMEQQIATVKDETQLVRESIGRARKVVDGIAKGEQFSQGTKTQNRRLQDDGSLTAAKNEKKRKREKQVWQAIEGELALT